MCYTLQKCRGVILTPCSTGRLRRPVAMEAQEGTEKKRLACPSLGGGKVEDIAAIIEVDDVLLTNLDKVNRVDLGVERQREGGFTDNAAGFAEVVNLIEVIRAAGLLRYTLQMGFTTDFDFHVEIPHFVNFKV